jgi:glycerol uptake facilitator-like aquaporin
LSMWSHLWVFLVANFGGATAAAMVFKLNNPRDS